jgi:hypothetical protein
MFNRVDLTILVVVVVLAIVGAWTSVRIIVNQLRKLDPPPVPNARTKKEYDEVPQQLIQLHNAWLAKAKRWEVYFYALTTCSVLFATLVASGDSLERFFVDKDDFARARTVVAIATALTTGMLAAFNPYKVYEDYIGAWRMVNTAKLEFLMKSDVDLAYVADQVRLAEDSLRDSRRSDVRPGQQQGAQQGGPT